MIVAVGALHRAFGLRELVAASYQAASGAGQEGIDALYDQLAKVGGNRTIGQRPGDVRSRRRRRRAVWRPAGAERGAVGRARSRTTVWSSEELKIRNETRKILGLPGLRVAATCVRVPVMVGHSLALHAVFGQRGQPGRRARGAA